MYLFPLTQSPKLTINHPIYGLCTIDNSGQISSIKYLIYIMLVEILHMLFISRAAAAKLNIIVLNKSLTCLRITIVVNYDNLLLSKYHVALSFTVIKYF